MVGAGLLGAAGRTDHVLGFRPPVALTDRSELMAGGRRGVDRAIQILSDEVEAR